MLERKSQADKNAVSCMFVGADAYIGPLGSCEIAGDSRKIGIFCGRTEASAPTEYGGQRNLAAGVDDSVGPFG